MRARLSLIASPILVAAVLAAPACGGGDDALDANFKAATADQRTNAVLGARGDVTGIALFVSTNVAIGAQAPGTTCPVVTVSGPDVTVTGGCTRTSTTGNTTYGGSFTIKNFALINPPAGTTPGD